jgi:hypothetical protein
MIVKLCDNCIRDLKDYNPYIVSIDIKKVESIKECDNYCNENGILNSENNKGGV